MSLLLFNRLKALDLASQDFAVFGSGPLAVRRIIEASNDLDVLCRRGAWDTVRKIGEIEYLPDYDVEIVKLGDCNVTFGTKWGIGAFDVDELIDTAEMIDGLPFVRMAHVIKYKTARASPKDMEHLKAVAEWRERQGEMRSNPSW